MAMRKLRRHTTQPNRGKGGKGAKKTAHTQNEATFAILQRQLMADNQQKLDNGNGALIPQAVADDTIAGLQQVAEDDMSSFRKGLQATLKGMATTINGMLVDLQNEITRISNDPAWKDLPISSRLKNMRDLTESLVRVANVERQYSNVGSKNPMGGGSLHLHLNVPTDPGEIDRRMEEYDRILGRHPNMIPSPPPGHQQRILIETKPIDGIDGVESIDRAPKQIKEEN